MDWVHYARCRDEDPELFFPVGTTGPAAMQVDAAKLVCAGRYAPLYGPSPEPARPLVKPEP